MNKIDITPDVLLNAYAAGIFPMSDDREDDTLFWVEPDQRGILPLNAFKLSKRLARTVRQDKFTVTANKDFRGVMQGCAETAKNRETTWISKRIEEMYVELHEIGYAHSVECWLDNKLVGGLYGVHIQSAFFGESMFTRETDASKVALVHLVSRLIEGGFTLLDTQFQTEHLAKFGTIKISKEDYHQRLAKALEKEANFKAYPSTTVGSVVLQPITQTS